MTSPAWGSSGTAPRTGTTTPWAWPAPTASPCTFLEAECWEDPTRSTQRSGFAARPVTSTPGPRNAARSGGGRRSGRSIERSRTSREERTRRTGPAAPSRWTMTTGWMRSTSRSSTPPWSPEFPSTRTTTPARSRVSPRNRSTSVMPSASPPGRPIWSRSAKTWRSSPAPASTRSSSKTARPLASAMRSPARCRSFGQTRSCSAQGPWIRRRSSCGQASAPPMSCEKPG